MRKFSAFYGFIVVFCASTFLLFSRLVYVRERKSQLPDIVIGPGMNATLHGNVVFKTTFLLQSKTTTPQVGEKTLAPSKKTTKGVTSKKPPSIKTASPSHKANSKSSPSPKNMTSSHTDADIVLYNDWLMRHSSNNWIILALADQGCVDMAINFYLTSLIKFNLTNYLIIGIDQKTCEVLEKHKINCFLYVSDKASDQASVYHSKDFLRKMNIRTFMILDALRLGYNVLHTDVDVYFMKNPFDNFDYKKHSYDLAPLMDMSVFNAGFLFIRSTNASTAVYEMSSHIAKTEPKTDDQRALNRAISSVGTKQKVRVEKLSTTQFQCGKKYWDIAKRNFAADKKCDACVVIHNNWMVSMEAKRYRFREMHMWIYDDNRYYSNPKAKYLTYDNEIIPKDGYSEQLDALKSALAIGAVLNRTVILPKFHCKGKRCTILDHLLLRKFEDKFQYRELSFLNNPLVPKSVRTSQSHILVISTEKYNELSKRDKRKPNTKIDVFKPKDVRKGATSIEIRKWFGSMQNPVLKFGNLIGAFCCYAHSQRQLAFEKNVKAAFVPGKYKQI